MSSRESTKARKAAESKKVMNISDWACVELGPGLGGGRRCDPGYIDELAGPELVVVR